MIGQKSIATVSIANTKNIKKKKENPDDQKDGLEVSFADFPLTGEYILLNRFDGMHSAGEADFANSQNNGRDGSRFLYRYWKQKKMILGGIVKAKTQKEMEEKIDEMKKFFNQKEGFVKWKFAEKIRKIPATSTAIEFPRLHYHITFCPFEITLIASDIAWQGDSKSAIFEDILGNFSTDFVNDGNILTEPKIIFSIKNPVENLKIQVGENWLKLGNAVHDDFFVIDSKKKRITKNGKIIDYEGVCPVFEPGSNTLIISTDGPTNIDMIVQYFDNFL